MDRQVEVWHKHDGQFTVTPLFSALIPSAHHQAFHLPLLPDLFVSLPHRLDFLPGDTLP